MHIHLNNTERESKKGEPKSNLRRVVVNLKLANKEFNGPLLFSSFSTVDNLSEQIKKDQTFKILFLDGDWDLIISPTGNSILRVSIDYFLDESIEVFEDIEVKKFISIISAFIKEVHDYYSIYKK